MQKGTKERFTIRQDCIDVAPRRWQFFCICHFTAPPFWIEIVNFNIFYILHFTLAVFCIAVATAQVILKLILPTIRENRGVFNLNIKTKQQYEI